MAAARAKLKSWYERTKLGDACDSDTHCSSCDPDGNCEACDTIDGRNMEAVAEYASTCDHCGDLTSHEQMIMDPRTQLGYCPSCMEKRLHEMPKDVQKRLKAQLVS